MIDGMLLFKSSFKLFFEAWNFLAYVRVPEAVHEDWKMDILSGICFLWGLPTKLGFYWLRGMQTTWEMHLQELHVLFFP